MIQEHQIFWVNDFCQMVKISVNVPFSKANIFFTDVAADMIRGFDSLDTDAESNILDCFCEWFVDEVLLEQAERKENGLPGLFDPVEWMQEAAKRFSIAELKNEEAYVKGKMLDFYDCYMNYREQQDANDLISSKMAEEIAKNLTTDGEFMKAFRGYLLAARSDDEDEANVGGGCDKPESQMTLPRPVAMREDEFYRWLISYKRNEMAPAKSKISRCKRVEQGLSIRLEKEYDNDQGKSLLERLTFKSDDPFSMASVPEGLFFDKGSNIKNGMASLKSAVKSYFDFCERTDPSRTKKIASTMADRTGLPSDDRYSDIKVGKLANTVLRRLLAHGNITETEVIKLQSPEYSKATFKLNFSVLVKKTANYEARRYYINPVEIHGVEYMLTSQWYEWNRSPLIQWLNAHDDPCKQKRSQEGLDDT